VEIAGGQELVGVVATDVDGDGLTDVVVLAHHSLAVTVHRNLGGGVFHRPAGPPVNALTRDLDVGDVDGDGDLDVALCAGYAGFGNVEVALNDGVGGLATGLFHGSGGGAMAVKLRDLDADGDLDLLWADSGDSPPYDFWTALNDGTGDFGQPTEWPVGTCGNGDVEAFDMDGDGDLDVVLTEYAGCIGSGAPPRAFFSENLGGGVFSAASIYETPFRPERVGHGDLDQDGDEDIVFTNAGGVTIGLADGLGGFAAPLQVALAQGAKDVSVVDLDGDGVLDLATSSFTGAPGEGATLSVLLGTGGATFGAPATLRGSYSPDLANARWLDVADLDGDGELDLAALNAGSNDVSIFAGLGGGAFAEHERTLTGPSPSAFAAADLTGDGAVDLVVVIGVPPAELSREIVVFEGLGGGGAEPPVRRRLPPSVRAPEWRSRR
jgi:hypothetical protein